MQDREPIKIRTNIAMVPIQERIKTMNQMFNFVSSWKEYREQKEGISRLLSSELDAPAPCRLNAPDLDFVCRASADCLHQHQQVI